MKYKNRKTPPGFYEQPIGGATAKRVLQLCGISNHCNVSDVRIFDFGCGSGRYMKLFAMNVPKENVIGADVNWLPLSKVRKSGFSCVLLPIADLILPFDNECFDVVFSSNVIEHIPRDLYLEYLKEIYRVLKPGGIFAVGAPNYPIKRLYDIWTAIKTPQYRQYYLFDDPTHCNKLSVFEVERDLNRLFENVFLEPSWIPFESNVALLRDQMIRHRMRIFGYKFFGNCNKPIQIKTE
jgi:SAM-dependent methyltransferase